MTASILAKCRGSCMKKRILGGAMTFAGACALFTLAMGGIAYASVPELDPGTASSGLALLAGGFLLLVERHRRRR